MPAHEREGYFGLLFAGGGGAAVNENSNSLRPLLTSTCCENDFSCPARRMARAASFDSVTDSEESANLHSTSWGPAVGPLSAVRWNWPSIIAVPADGPFDLFAGRNTIIPRFTGVPAYVTFPWTSTLGNPS